MEFRLVIFKKPLSTIYQSFKCNILVTSNLQRHPKARFQVDKIGMLITNLPSFRNSFQSNQLKIKAKSPFPIYHKIIHTINIM